MRILVIEDDLATVKLLAFELEKDGHVVAGELTAAAGKRRALGESWDVILSDIGLPDDDGFSLARQLRQAGVTTRLVALSGHATDEDRARGLASGFDEYLTKPIKSSVLREEMRRQGELAAAARATPPARRRGVLGGLVVIALGVPFVLQQLGVPNGASYLFITMGIA